MKVCVKCHKWHFRTVKRTQALVGDPCYAISTAFSGWTIQLPAFAPAAPSAQLVFSQLSHTPVHIFL